MIKMSPEDKVQGRFSSLNVPIIFNESLRHTNIKEYFSSNFKVKISNCTPLDSIMLPRSGMALLIINAAHINISEDSLMDQRDKIAEDTKETVDQLCARVSNFRSNHRHSAFIIMASAFGEEEIGFILRNLSLRFLPSPPVTLIAHGEAQVAAHIQVLAKSTTSEARLLLQERINNVIDTQNKDFNQVMAEVLGLDYHQSSVLLDTFGSIPAAISMPADVIHENTPLDQDTSRSIQEFINNDNVIL